MRGTDPVSLVVGDEDIRKVVGQGTPIQRGDLLVWRYTSVGTYWAVKALRSGEFTFSDDGGQCYEWSDVWMLIAERAELMTLFREEAR